MLDDCVEQNRFIDNVTLLTWRWLEAGEPVLHYSFVLL